jgi:hypothetical protein
MLGLTIFISFCSEDKQKNCKGKREIVLLNFQINAAFYDIIISGFRIVVF